MKLLGCQAGEKEIVHQDDLIIVACGAVSCGGGWILAIEMGYETVMAFSISMVIGVIIAAIRLWILPSRCRRRVNII